MEGTLYKWINFFMGWKQKYFILKSSILHIYERKGGSPKEKIHLAVTDLIKRDRLEIILDTGIKLIYLKAESTEIRDLWFNAMKKIKKEADLNRNIQEEIELGSPMNLNEENFGSYIDNVEKYKNSYIKIDYNSQRDTSSLITGNISPNISPTKYSTKRNSCNINFENKDLNLIIDSNFLNNLRKLIDNINFKIIQMNKNNILFNYFISGADEKKKIVDFKNEIIPLYYQSKEDLRDTMVYIEEINTMINNHGQIKENFVNDGNEKDKTPDKNYGKCINLNLNSNGDSNSNSKLKNASTKNNFSITNSEFKSKHNKFRNLYNNNLSPSNFCDNINSINSNNGNLITLSECKVYQESKGFDNSNRGKNSDSYKMEKEDKEKVSEVLAFPDEVQGAVIYEIVESNNQTNSDAYINTNNSISNTKNSSIHLKEILIADKDSSIYKDHLPVSITFENNFQESNDKNLPDNSFEKIQYTLSNNQKEESNKNSDNTYYDSINIYNNSAYINKRNSLPGLRYNYRSGIWSILKDSIGKEFSSITVPVFYEEPLSLLQRLCENFQYSYLLNQAASEEKSHIRICLLSAFILGGFSFPNDRIFKPVNPFLGETYEYMDKDLKFKFFAEQVSIDPPISAIRVEGDGYILTSNIIIKSKFQIKKDLLEIFISGNSQIHFTKFDEIITFTKPKISLRNFITIDKKLKIEIIGKLQLESDKTNSSCEIELSEGKFVGAVKLIDEYGENNSKKEGVVITKISGALCDDFKIYDLNSNTSQIICNYRNFSCDDIEKFYFNEFMSNLNNLNDDLIDSLPCTDSRFRKDTRALEFQDFENVVMTREKYEENQKLLLKSFILKKLPYEPKYFTKFLDEESREIRYVYCRNYWEDRKNRKFGNFPKIFT